ALLRERSDVDERCVQAASFATSFAGARCSIAVPELELAHSGRVDEDAAAGNEEHLTRRCGVAAFAVGLAHVVGGLAMLAQQRVDERGFADAGGAEERAGLRWADSASSRGNGACATGCVGGFVAHGETARNAERSGRACSPANEFAELRDAVAAR